MVLDKFFVPSAIATLRLAQDGVVSVPTDRDGAHRTVHEGNLRQAQGGVGFLAVHQSETLPQDQDGRYSPGVIVI